MGVVYRAFDERLKRVVALKVLRFRLVDPGRRENLASEAQVAATLKHPNIVAVYDTGFPVDAKMEDLAIMYTPGLAMSFPSRQCAL